MKKSHCGSCLDRVCISGGKMDTDYCPMNIHPEVFERAESIYKEDPQTRRMAKHAAMVETSGYIRWPRLRDIIAFSRWMDYQRLAVVFCPDLWSQAHKTVRILKEHAFSVSSRVCRIKAGESGQANARLSDLTAEIEGLKPDAVIIAGLCTAAEASLTKDAASPCIAFLARDAANSHWPAVEIYRSEAWKDWAKDVYARRK